MINYDALGIKPYGKTPNERQLEWYSREKMIFFHFGMNTFTGKEWGDGTENPLLFNPTELDTDQWLKAVSAAGFKCAILTAKHHDGFCLWPTKYTEHSIKNSPYKNGKGDVVREFVDSCRKYGVKAGIYLSPWDRHEKTWGKDEYNDFYVGQLTELLTGYGEIHEVWWDGAGSTEAVYDWERWARTVRTLAPNAVIFGSLGATPWVDVRWVGNEKGIAGKPCYATIDKSSLVYEITSELNAGKIGGDSFIPAEVDVSIRPGWFYHSEQDSDVRTPNNLIDLYFSSNGSNAGLLLNLPPDKRGLIHESDVASLLRFNEILTKSTENNLAMGATVSASSEMDSAPAANILLSDDTVYAPKNGDVCPEITLLLEKEIEFNSFEIKEAIELGHKITDIEICAKVNGKWQTLSRGKCVGYRLAEKFDAVRSDEIKIKIHSALDTPVIKYFGLYKFELEKELLTDTERVNLAARDIAKIDILPNEIDVNFGGVYSFDSIKVTGIEKCKYQLEIFNGTSFETYMNGESGKDEIFISLDTPIDWAYRIKLTFIDTSTNKNMKIEIY